jgi:hypothetical protein
MARKYEEFYLKRFRSDQLRIGLNWLITSKPILILNNTRHLSLLSVLQYLHLAS